MTALKQTRPVPPPVDVRGVEVARAGLRTFFRIAEAGCLTAQQQQTLLGVGKTTLFAWRAGTVRSGLDPSVLERLSYIFGIFGALEILLPIPERAHAWLRKPNASPLFGGGSALERMLGGRVGDLMVVHAWLDAQRGGDFS
jgi:hypothetical protein